MGRQNGSLVRSGAPRGIEAGRFGVGALSQF